MKKRLLFVLMIGSYCVSNAQVDTVFTYYNTTGKVDTKEMSLRYIKKYQSGELWVTEFYQTYKDVLTSRSTYLDKACTIANGNIDDFYENGAIKCSFNLVKNQHVWLKYFYPNGTLNSIGFYDAKGNLVKQEGYDTSGKIIKGYIIARMSDFKGGPKGWADYLSTHLDADVPKKNNAPTGTYSVMLSFMIEADGRVTRITAETDPGYGTKEEAIRVLKNGPKWLPAIQNNQFVMSSRKQVISFLVQ
jgi:hypothetical protein